MNGHEYDELTADEEALTSAEEAIEFHLEGLLDEGRELPAPGAVATYQALPEYAGGVWASVEAYLND
ncbi:type II toxin-antitoxin system HicB family antitoxin [Acidiferrobacter sp.]|uniref:type II toxin-antitoxin system HicB family antitoxin n=1 Tax=Acidiferrobacter sp. TaxID=1872107 RepID=UPI00262DF96C|nr:type II toxin-antitoxin system HicB family antitoxin [Acidiferrobacter sp.]